MKRIISFFMTVALLILLCGCGAEQSSVGERPEDVREELWDYTCEIFEIVDKCLDGEVSRQKADESVSELCEEYSSALHELNDATLREWVLDVELMSFPIYLAGGDIGAYTIQDLITFRNKLAADFNYPLKTSIK